MYRVFVVYWNDTSTNSSVLMGSYTSETEATKYWNKYSKKFPEKCFGLACWLSANHPARASADACLSV